MTSTAANDLAAIRAQLRALASPAIAAHAVRFFKTGPGEYGEGDRFLGIRVPVLRRVARERRAASVATMFALLRSPLHEERLLALLLLVDAFRHADEHGRERIYRGYADAALRDRETAGRHEACVSRRLGGYAKPRARNRQATAAGASMNTQSVAT